MKSFRKIQMPDTLVILFCIAILIAITSYFIPVGKFDVKKIQYSSDGQTYSRSVLPLLCFIFSLGGAVFGMGEETIPFILLLVPIFVLIGFDALTCTIVIYLATQIGFATSWMNPFSVSIAQGIAELPILSGSLFRIIMWFIFTLSISIFAVFYALKIQKNHNHQRCIFWP
ncbi:S-transferase, partial [Francisella tularensis subsp. holarctica]|nr:S-transferase [Francisella tularensis subsp. holarctica]